MMATPRTFTEVSQLVRSAGRVVTVELPDEIADIDGYDPVEPDDAVGTEVEQIMADLANDHPAL